MDAGLSHTQKDEKVIQCKLLIRVLKRRYHFLRKCVARRIFKWILKQEGRGASIGLTGSGQIPAAGSSKHDVEP
jgi:hypothetical protein